MSDYTDDRGHPIPDAEVSFSNATWEIVTHRAESANPIRAEEARRSRIEMLGRALESEGTIPAEARAWLGYALVEIANGVAPKLALGLKQGKGRKKNERDHFRRAADMVFLVESGMSQIAAANLLAEFHDRNEAKPFIVAYGDLRKRRGVFSDVRSYRVYHLAGIDSHPVKRSGLPELGQIPDTRVTVDLFFPGELVGFCISLLLVKERLARE